MDSENLGRWHNLQNQDPSGQQSRFRFGIHFSNTPADVRRAELEAFFSEFGQCRVKMDQGATHGWVGYNSMQECNNANAAMNPNPYGMYIRKGPYEAGLTLRPPTGGLPVGRPPMGGPPVGRPPMGGPPVGRPPMGGPPVGRPPMGGPPMGRRLMGGPPMGRRLMGGPPMGGEYSRSYGPMCNAPCGLLSSPLDFYDDDLYDYYGYPYEALDYEYMYDDMYPELSGCDVGPCLVCGARTSYSCERCGAFYCSEGCQRRDWSTHRELCDKNIPSLNFGPRHRPGSGDIQAERKQRLTSADGCGSSPRPSGGIQEGRSPTKSRTNDDDRQSGDRRSEGESKWQRSDSGTRRGDNDSADRRRRNDDQYNFGGGFSSRCNDRRSNDSYDRRSAEECRNEGSFGDGRGDSDIRGERRNEGGLGDSKPMGECRYENGFDDRRRDGDGRGERRYEGGFGGSKPMGERRNENGFDYGRGDSDRRRECRNEGGFGDSKPLGECRYENGFGNRRGVGDRRVERRIDGGFGDRRRDGDRRQMGERRNENGFGDRRPIGERRNEGGFGDCLTVNSDRKLGNTEDRPRFRDKKSKETVSDKAKSPKSENPLFAVEGSEIKANVAMASLLKKTSGGEVSQSELELVSDTGVCVNLKVNDTVVISNATALDSIYVTPPLSALTEDFTKVITGMLFHCKSAPVLDRAPAPNEVVACQFTFDNNFYRAVVKEILAGGDYVMQFCDYGNVQKCKVDRLKAIPDELKKCPWNAVKVSLSGVSNVPIAGPIQRLFVDLMDQEVNLKLQFDGDLSKGVVLIKPNGESVNELVKSLIAQAAAPEKTVDPAAKDNSPTPKVDSPAPKDDTPSLVKENVPSVSSDSVSPRPPLQVLSSLLTKVKLSDTDASATYPAEVGTCTELNNDETVVITASTGTGSTYITRATPSRDLAEVTQKLNKYCETASSLGREPKDKEVVACQYVDKLYYRAVVSEVLPNGEYVLTFCDYGNAAKYKAEDLKAVPNELKMLPRQAVQVYFRGIEPVPVTGKVGEILEQLSVEETQLKLKFSGSIENGVELIRPDGKSVNEELHEVILQGKKAVSEPAAAGEEAEPEDLSPAASVPLPTGKPFTICVFGILGDFIVAACNAEALEVELFEKNFAPRILEYCQTSQEKEHRPEPGQMCLAKFNDDWYRALTMSTDEDGSRDVFFVDYGNTSKVTPSEIRKIPKEIRSQLHTLTLCTIVGVKESPDVWEKIKTRIEKDTVLGPVAVFANVTAVMQSDSTADIIIPELQSL